VTFQTSPDNSTWSVVPNTPCSSTIQPPCILQGANPIVGTQGMAYMASYGAYVRVAVTGSTGTGTGTVRGYGAKGASANAGSIGGGGGSGNLSFVTINPVGSCTVGVPDEKNTVTGALLSCIGPPGPNNGTWALIIAANSAPLLYYYTDTASDIATYLQATVPTFSPKTTLTFTGVTAGSHTIQNWATNAGVPGVTSFPAGAYTQHIHALRVSGGTVTLHTEFWEVSSVGVDIAKIGTSEDTPNLTTSELEYTLQFADSNVYPLASVNSRIVGRVVAVVTGAAVTMRVFVGGTADSHIQIPGNSGSTGTGATSCPVVATSSVSCLVNLDTTGPLFADCWDATSGKQILVGSTGTHSTATTVNSVYAIDGTHVGVDFSGSTTATCYISTGGQGPPGPIGATGPVSSVSFTGGIVTVNTPTTTPALIIAGTSGGIPYFASPSTWATSAALTQYGPVLGGGSGNPPTVVTPDTTTTHALFATGTAPAFRAIASTDLPANSLIRTCTVITGDPGAASSALADDNDSPVACGNTWGSDWHIQSVTCWANAGSPTVTPILTGGSGTSILTGALTCGTASWAAGTVQGTAPIVHTFSGTGATCSVTPCTIDMNITTAGGTAKYIVVRIVGTI
jgi:hypothetical protein